MRRSPVPFVFATVAGVICGGGVGLAALSARITARRGRGTAGAGLGAAAGGAAAAFAVVQSLRVIPDVWAVAAAFAVAAVAAVGLAHMWRRGMFFCWRAAA